MSSMPPRKGSPESFDDGDGFGGGFGGGGFGGGGDFGPPNLPGSWKPVSDDSGGSGARMFIQTGSRMNNLPDDEDPF